MTPPNAFAYRVFLEPKSQKQKQSMFLGEVIATGETQAQIRILKNWKGFPDLKQKVLDGEYTLRFEKMDESNSLFYKTQKVKQPS